MIMIMIAGLHLAYPGSKYGIFACIYHTNDPSVGKYTSLMDRIGDSMCIFLDTAQFVFFLLRITEKKYEMSAF